MAFSMEPLKCRACGAMECHPTLEIPPLKVSRGPDGEWVFSDLDELTLWKWVDELASKCPWAKWTTPAPIVVPDGEEIT